MEKNKRYWDMLKSPPATALKTISAGRLKGKSDINPQWRYEAMTEVFGPCGLGWKYAIEKIWTEPASDGQVFVFAQVSVQIKTDEDWSDPIQGTGGSMLIQKETAGLHSNDEGCKMAITDAIGTALKMLGVAADVYAGKWDGSKYIDSPPKKQPNSPKTAGSKDKGYDKEYKKLPIMNKDNGEHMSNAYLILKKDRPEGTTEEDFKREICVKTYKLLGNRWPKSQADEETIISKIAS